MCEISFQIVASKSLSKILNKLLLLKGVIIPFIHLQRLVTFDRYLTDSDIFQGFENVRFYDDVTIKFKDSQANEYICRNNQIYKQEVYPDKTYVDYGFLNFNSSLFEVNLQVEVTLVLFIENTLVTSHPPIKELLQNLQDNDNFNYSHTYCSSEKSQYQCQKFILEDFEIELWSETQILD